MTAILPTTFMARPSEEQPLLTDRWRSYLALGIVLFALGFVAIAWVSLATLTLAAMWAFGVLLLIGGVVEIVGAFRAGRSRSVLVHLLLGVLYLVAGYAMIDRPVESALLLTKFFSIFLIIAGAFRIVVALSERFPQWGMVLFNGALSLLLGVLIYKQWPASGLWFIGLALGLDMLFTGWTWILVALHLRRVATANA